MAREVFVDAGAWIAVGIARDQYHSAAVETYRRLLHETQSLVTTNLVICEAHIAIRRVGGHEAAMRFLQSLRRSSRVKKVYADASLDAEAEEILACYVDQDFSLVDAVSFAAMRKLGISEAFAFDRHFLTAGFVLVPAPAT